MSVGVFPLQSGKATRGGRGPGEGVRRPEQVAGRRHVPLHAAGRAPTRCMVITPQADYLDDIQQWLERIDGAGARRAAVLVRAEVRQGQGPRRPPVRGVRRQQRQRQRGRQRRAVADAGHQIRPRSGTAASTTPAAPAAAAIGGDERRRSTGGTGRHGQRHRSIPDSRQRQRRGDAGGRAATRSACPRSTKPTRCWCARARQAWQSIRK